jgi:hypothetical protein
MDWLSLEGIPRVKASYQVWKRCKRLLRHTRRQSHVSRKTLRFLKEDVENEYDELVDAILSLTRDECKTMLSSVKYGGLYDLLCLYKN